MLEYFEHRKKDLRIINFIRDQDAATKIAEFLGYSGHYSRPQRNVNPKKHPPPEYAEILQRCARKLGLTEEETKYDTYCPSLVRNMAQLKYPKDSSQTLPVNYDE